MFDFITSHEFSRAAESIAQVGTGLAAVLAVLLGARQVDNWLKGEAIKRKIEVFQEGNRRASEAARRVVDFAENKISANGHRAVKREDLEEIVQEAGELEKGCSYATEFSQTMAYLFSEVTRRFFEQCEKSTPPNNTSVMNYYRFCLSVSEKIYNASRSVVDVPKRIRFKPLHNLPRGMRRDR